MSEPEAVVIIVLALIGFAAFSMHMSSKDQTSVADVLRAAGIEPWIWKSKTTYYRPRVSKHLKRSRTKETV